MESDQERIRVEYAEKFDPHDYKGFRVDLLKNKRYQDNHEFWFSSLYNFFTTEKYSGDRLLDLASGPTVHNVATASTYFSDIILSDIAEKNCEQLRKWLKKDPDCMDWKFMLRIVAMAENREDVEEACKEIEDRIRSAVKDVIHCDVLNDEVIAKEYCQQPFDLIISSLTLEPASANLESYTKCLGRINRLLRKGGKLILISLTNCSGYTVGNHIFNFLPLDETEIEHALRANGFGDIYWKFRKQPDDDGLPYLCEKVYFLSCSKL